MSKIIEIEVVGGNKRTDFLRQVKNSRTEKKDFQLFTNTGNWDKTVLSEDRR